MTMATLDNAKTILEADSTLLATATGGIWSFDETGRMGINRTANAAAFTSAGIIKPCVLLKLRSSIPDYVLADDANQYVSLSDHIEAWFYSDNSYTAIETMKLRVFALLHTKQLGAFQCLWDGDVRPGIRDTDLDAFVEISSYKVRAKRSV